MTQAHEAEARTKDKDVDAPVNYAGHIVGRAGFDVVNPEKTNASFEPHQVHIRDVRGRELAPLEESGFAFVKHRSAVAEDPAFFESNLEHQYDRTELNGKYEDELSAHLRDMFGADQVFAQYSGLIARTSSRAKKRSWGDVAGFVHADFTEKSANQFLAWSRDANGFEHKPYSRFMLMQTWRVVSPAPQDTPLAICDSRTVPPEDTVVFDTRLGPEEQPGNFFEARFCKYRPSHEWYYLSDMEPDDVLLFTGYDSAAPLGANAMHSAFDNPLGQDGPPRQSIEARFFVLWD
jgi:hypothetical protein